MFRKVVNVTSISGTMGNAGQANYSSGKAGVVGLTKTLAKEWGQLQDQRQRRRLRLHRDAPDRLQGGGQRRWRSAARRCSSASPTRCARWRPITIPLGRPGTPEEAAGGVFFLCSPWSNYVHGQVLNVTGGQWSGMTT